MESALFARDVSTLWDPAKITQGTGNTEIRSLLTRAGNQMTLHLNNFTTAPLAGSTADTLLWGSPLPAELRPMARVSSTPQRLNVAAAGQVYVNNSGEVRGSGLINSNGFYATLTWAIAGGSPAGALPGVLIAV